MFPSESIKKSALPIPIRLYATVSPSGSMAETDPTSDPTTDAPRRLNEYGVPVKVGAAFEVEIDTGAVSDPPVADAVTVNE